jgi:hypothetical protein
VPVQRRHALAAPVCKDARRESKAGQAKERKPGQAKERKPGQVIPLDDEDITDF